MKTIKLSILIFIISISVSYSKAQQVPNLAQSLEANSEMPQLIRLFNTLNGGGEFEQFLFSPNERYIAITTVGGNSASIVDIAQNQIIALVNHDADITDMAFSSNSEFLITAGSDGIIKSWDTLSFNLHTTTSTNSFPIYFSDMWGGILIFANNNGIILWDIYSGSEVLRDDFIAIQSAFSKSGHLQAILQNTGEVIIFDTTNYIEQSLYMLHSECHDSKPINVAFATDSNIVFVGCDNGDLLILNTSDAAETQHLSGMDYLPFVINAQNSNILPLQQEDGTISFIDISSSENVQISILDSYINHNTLFAISSDGSVAILGIVPDDNWEATGLGAPGADVVNTYTGEPFYFLGRTVYAQFSPSEQYLLTVSVEGWILLFQLR